MNVLSESGGKLEAEQENVEAETILSLVRNCSFTRNNADTGAVCDRIQVAAIIFTGARDIFVRTTIHRGSTTSTACV